MNKTRKRFGEAIEVVYSMLPVAGITHPVFIIGCGRSGTTILGTALSRHRAVTYLNEPRKLWTATYPDTNIWEGAAARRGSLALTSTDTNIRRSRKLRRLFRLETIRNGKPVLVEKLPANCFRLPFVHAIFPDARFVYIRRNGLEVARSIAGLCDKGRWYNANPYKWDQLTRHALTAEETAALPGLCTGNYEKGLLEWRLSTAAITKFLDNLPGDAFTAITYEKLVESPVETIRQVIAFIGLAEDAGLTSFVKKNISRRSDDMDYKTLSETERRIGGGLLLRSLRRESA